MPEIVPVRICIYAKDVQNITGKKERTARKLLSDIRYKLGKQKKDFVTVSEFCEYTGLRIDHVQKFILY